MLIAIIIGLWIIGITAKLAVCIHIHAAGLLTKYPATFAALALDAIKSGWLVSTYLAAGPRAYGREYAQWEWIHIVVIVALCAESMHVMGRHFGVESRYKLAFAAAFVALGITAASLAAVRWTAHPIAATLIRSVPIACAVSIIAAREWYGAWISMRPNARRHWAGVCGLVVIASLGQAMIRLAANHQPLDGAGHIVLRIAPLMAASWWLRMDWDGEFWIAPRVSAEEGTERHEKLSRIIRRLNS